MKMTLGQQVRYKDYSVLLADEEKDLKKRLAEAGKEGDISENAEYDAARVALEKNHATISKLAMILSHAEVIPAQRDKSIGIGSFVTLRYTEKVGIESLDSEEGETFEITDKGSIKTPGSNATLLPISSQVGSILYNQHVSEGQIVSYSDTTRISRNIKILKVDNSDTVHKEG